MTWKDLENELTLWRGEGRTPEFWWRDDDAGGATPELERLLALQERTGIPLALAVVPARAAPAMLAALAAGVSVLQHGTDHANRAGAGEKKTEFPAAEAPADALARLASAKERLQEQVGARFCPVLAPPWNRLPEPLVPLLKTAYIGLSRYGPRKASGALRQINTHVDIIAWQTGRGFVGEESALRMTVSHLALRRSGKADAREPTGLLTHHACHDEAAWRFLERLFSFTSEAGARWRDASALFR